MKIFIVGLPGSGKSTLGARLALRLKVPFLDLDTLIEQEAQQPIRDIFTQQGEAAFREAEQRALSQVIRDQPAFVLATGGGAPCFHNNMYLMNQSGTTLYLDVPVAVIVERMRGTQLTDRPLLHGLDLGKMEKEYTAKFEKRLPVYRQAHITVDHCTPLEEIADRLSARS